MKSSEFRLEELLALVGSSPLESATSEVLALAEAVWYQGYRPTQADLDSLARSVEHQSFKRTLCVLELLSQYPVCPRSTAKELQKLTQDFHVKYSSPGSSEALKGRYSPSKRWGLAEATGPIRQSLLSIQTRSYAISKGGLHGFSAQ